MSSEDKKSKLIGVDDPEFEHKLLAYYQHLFPFQSLYDWLSYGSQEQFHCREFAFWLLPSRFSSSSSGTDPAGGASNNHASSNLFFRYQCYDSPEAFRAALAQRVVRFGEQTIVERMEIGPVYRTPPLHNHTSAACVPVSREFVIDIDMDDYNAVRNCCRGAQVCSSCWAFMKIAVKVIDHLLLEQFNFRRLLWVFSGRRGVHCWVSDDHARRMSQAERAAIIENFSLLSKKHDQGADVTDPLLPRLRHLHQSVLLPFFEGTILPQQDLLREEGTMQRVLGRLPEQVAARLRDDWGSGQNQLDSAQRWRQLQLTYEKSGEPGYRRRMYEIVFEFTYPRFDVKVSEDLNHLLKAPFCIHPKTGLVSIPFEAAQCDAFDATRSAPSLQGLVDALQTRGNIDHDLFKEGLRVMERYVKALEMDRHRTSDIEDIATSQF